eukprot:182953_1
MTTTLPVITILAVLLNNARHSFAWVCPPGHHRKAPPRLRHRRSPTLTPTTSPTRRPTRGPTMQPSSTTRSPTITPTVNPTSHTITPSFALQPTTQASKSPSSPYTTEIFIVSFAILIILVVVCCFGLLYGIRRRKKRKQTYAMDSQVLDPIELPAQRLSESDTRG